MVKISNCPICKSKRKTLFENRLIDGKRKWIPVALVCTSSFHFEIIGENNLNLNDEKENFFKNVIKYIKTDNIAQQYKIRSLIEDFEISSSEMDNVIPNREIIHKSVRANKNFKFNNVSQFFYEDLDPNTGIRKQRELDVLTQQFLVNNDKYLITITLIGDVKNTNDYGWIFYQTKDVDYSLNFPIIIDNHRYTGMFDQDASLIIILPYDSIPLVSEFLPFFKSGHLNQQQENGNARDNNLNPRNFFQQITSGLDNYISQKLSRNTSVSGENKGPRHIELIIPIIIISSDFYGYNTQNPSSEKDFFELNNGLYLFTPTYSPKILKEWKIPILITNEKHIHETLKILVLNFYNQWKNSNLLLKY